MTLLQKLEGNNYMPIQCSFSGCGREIGYVKEKNRYDGSKKHMLCQAHLMRRRRGYEMKLIGKSAGSQPVDCIPGEKWKILERWPGYKISSYGRVTHYNTKFKVFTLLKPQYSEAKMLYVQVRDKKGKPIDNIYVGFWMSKLFLKRKKYDFMYNKSRLVYKDGNRKNCHVENLIWHDDFYREEHSKVLSTDNSEEGMQIKKFISGDQKALDKYYYVCRDFVLRVLSKIFNGEWRKYITFEDVFQEAWLKYCGQLLRGVKYNSRYIKEDVLVNAKWYIFDRVRRLEKYISYNDEIGYAVC